MKIIVYVTIERSLLGDNQTIDSGSRSLRDIPKSQATASAVSMKK